MFATVSVLSYPREVGYNCPAPLHFIITYETQAFAKKELQLTNILEYPWIHYWFLPFVLFHQTGNLL